MFVAAFYSITPSKERIQPMCSSTDEWNRYTLIYPHNGILFDRAKDVSADTHHNVINLENITLSEVNHM